MKVILVNRYFFPDESATSRMATSLARSLAASGWCVHAVTGSVLHNNSRLQLVNDETIDGIAVHRLKTSWFGRGKLFGRAIDYATFHMATLWRLLRLARRGDLCIVCTDPPLLSVSSMLPLWLKNAVQVNWLLDLFPEVAIELGVATRRKWFADTALRLRDLSLRRSPANIAPIRRMAEHLEARGIRSETLVTIHHWSNGADVTPVAPERNGLREEWQLGDRFVVGYSGNFGRAHDFLTFLDAAERLQEDRDIIFVFIGGGHQQRVIEGAIAKRRLSNILLKPLQPRERLAEALGLPDLHLISLLPAMEPFVIPSKLYGILAAGRPTAFVGDVSGEIATVLRNWYCGYSVSLGDGDGLAQIVLKLKNDRELRAHHGKNARMAFDAQFTEAKGTAAWREVLDKIARPASASLSERSCVLSLPGGDHSEA